MKELDDNAYLEQFKHELSDSVQRARWIGSTQEHEEQPGQSLVTRSHDVIRRWAEQRGAEPATVPGTEHGGHGSVLRFDFPGYGGRELEHISWDDWFRTFDQRQLVFIFQEHLKRGNESNFFRLESPLHNDG